MVYIDIIIVMSDLFRLFPVCTENVRLCIIEYAGLTTNSEAPLTVLGCVLLQLN